MCCVLCAPAGHWDAGGSQDGLLPSPRTLDIGRQAGLTGNVLEGQVVKHKTSGHRAGEHTGEDEPGGWLPAHEGGGALARG